jgi:hypothetical protein
MKTRDFDIDIIINKAISKYPIGTVFYSALTGIKYKIISNIFESLDNKSIVVPYCMDYNRNIIVCAVTIFNGINNKWAKIDTK